MQHELHTVFEEAVNDYLETCKKAKRSPQKAYSGHIMLRAARAACKSCYVGGGTQKKFKFLGNRSAFQRRLSIQRLMPETTIQQLLNTSHDV
jgi:hypothetical protein